MSILVAKDEPTDDAQQPQEKISFTKNDRDAEGHDDAFIWMMITAICLTYFALPVTHPFLFLLVIVLIFSLVYVISVVLRLRKAAMSFPEEQREEQVTPFRIQFAHS
jgi:hypothetical protein